MTRLKKNDEHSVGREIAADEVHLAAQVVGQELENDAS
jgi:hypothetical protein